MPSTCAASSEGVGSMCLCGRVPGRTWMEAPLWAPPSVERGTREFWGPTASASSWWLPHPPLEPVPVSPACLSHVGLLPPVAWAPGHSGQPSSDPQ